MAWPGNDLQDHGRVCVGRDPQDQTGVDMAKQGIALRVWCQAEGGAVARSPARGRLGHSKPPEGLELSSPSEGHKGRRKALCSLPCPRLHSGCHSPRRRSKRLCSEHSALKASFGAALRAVPAAFLRGKDEEQQEHPRTPAGRRPPALGGQELRGLHDVSLLKGFVPSLTFSAALEAPAELSRRISGLGKRLLLTSVPCLVANVIFWPRIPLVQSRRPSGAGVRKTSEIFRPSQQGEVHLGTPLSPGSSGCQQRES